MSFVNLNHFDLIVVNSSGGKDSQTALRKVARLAEKQLFSSSKIVVSHQDLGESEWPGTTDLVHRQAKFYGFKVVVSRYRNKDGEEKTLLDYVERRGKWPSSKQRFCTSDFKRGPGDRVIRSLTPDGEGPFKVLNVFGFRAEESPARAKRLVWSLREKVTTHDRSVYDWLPIHKWTERQVWDDIKASGVPYHPAYDAGMPRLSCAFCIFANKDALLLAGSMNRELLRKYAEVERSINHTFRTDVSLTEVEQELDRGVKPERSIQTWRM